MQKWKLKQILSFLADIAIPKKSVMPLVIYKIYYVSFVQT
jgi:hypothetical protein